jgi:uncharacterized protein YciI
VKYVLFYQVAEGMTMRSAPHFPAHLAWLAAFHARGTLLMVGTFDGLKAGDGLAAGDGLELGAMTIFTTREAAEQFVKDDPFVLSGVVRNWYIREFDEILVGPPR